MWTIATSWSMVAVRRASALTSSTVTTATARKATRGAVAGTERSCAATKPTWTFAAATPVAPTACASTSRARLPRRTPPGTSSGPSPGTRRSSSSASAPTVLSTMARRACAGTAAPCTTSSAPGPAAPSSTRSTPWSARRAPSSGATWGSATSPSAARGRGTTSHTLSATALRWTPVTRVMSRSASGSAWVACSSASAPRRWPPA
mmetsp:Transcript_43762/g.136212  ORF Transcript_43762/g.136212 Transcript_43762/m.136212 type:complete len:205 (+) Transcript_43762:325-939(+)